MRGWASRFSVDVVLSDSTESNRRETLLCFRNFLLSKEYRAKSGGRLSRSSVNTVLSHSTESIRRKTFMCFSKFRVSKNFMPRRGMSRFSIEKSLSHSSEKVW